MSFKLAIASGKGGTGKTTIAINLYYYLSRLMEQEVTLVDCDVEVPNDVLFFRDAQLNATQKVEQLIPHINQEKCTFCGSCVEYCSFNAISLIKSLHHASISSDLCHSCGACLLACQYDAISEHPKEVGIVNYYSTPFGAGLSEGRLNIGSSMQTFMIKATKQQAPKGKAITIMDAPPGTSCPVVETVADADYVVLVAEPTPFGLHDMKLMVSLLNDLHLPFGIVVNKYGYGSDETLDFINENQLDLLAKIPFDRAYANAYSKGQLTSGSSDSIKNTFSMLTQKIVDVYQQQNSNTLHQ
ncbi:nucleotide-binding protein [Roseimarinus sediminis]|uniref:nucleotide-binding protein n=1 Tax=Roseimarinus sediminis TaxID=1610899 RepID=UPI003D25DCA4